MKKLTLDHLDCECDGPPINYVHPTSRQMCDRCGIPQCQEEDSHSDAVNMIKEDLYQVLIERGHDPDGLMLWECNDVYQIVGIIAEAIQSGRIMRRTF